jgi:16S rRNA (guanine527-N7)-methyltransferase
LRQVDGPAAVDVGSGGGLPGVVLAVTNPSMRVVCVDAVSKKAAFVTQAAAELKLRNLTAVHQRVEVLTGSFDLITSRAFSSLRDFVAMTKHLRKPTGVWMAMKGKDPDCEVAELPGEVSVFHVEHLQVPGLVGDRCLVWMGPSPKSLEGR